MIAVSPIRTEASSIATSEDVCERAGLRLGLVGPELQLGEAKLPLLGEQVVDPLARRVHLEPVAGVRGDERPAAAVLLHAQVPLGRAGEHGLELVLVERDAEVVDPRDPPVAGLHDDVHRAALELREPQLEAVVVELLPGDPGLDRDVVVADPAVARDEMEAELAQVASLDVAELRGDEVVVEELHAPILPRLWIRRRC